MERAREAIALIVHNVQSSIIKYTTCTGCAGGIGWLPFAKIAMNYCYAIHSSRVADAGIAEGEGNFV